MRIEVAFCSIFLFCIIFSGCYRSDTPAKKLVGSKINVDIKALASNYSSLKLMTPEPVFVNPELAALCVGASEESVNRARIDNGVHANCSAQIYMNEQAANAFNNGLSYPAGSVVIKEKSTNGFRRKSDNTWTGEGSGVGGMVKREHGFDNYNGNWEYFYVETDSEIQVGKLDSCIDCHRRAKKTDFVFGDWDEADNTMDPRMPDQ